MREVRVVHNSFELNVPSCRSVRNLRDLLGSV